MCVFQPSAVAHNRCCVPRSHSACFLGMLVGFLHPPPQAQGEVLSQGRFLTEESESKKIHRAGSRREYLPVRLEHKAETRKKLLDCFYRSVQELFTRCPETHIIHVPDKIPYVKHFLDEMVEPLQKEVRKPL